MKFLSFLPFLVMVGILISNVNVSNLYGESEENIIPTSEKLSPTYVVDITTGSGVSYKFQHFYPLSIAIPIDTTIAWFNDDPEQIHTVTSSNPGAPNSGKLFNSGIIQYLSTFQYTFSQPGTVSYHCEIHPWMIGSVYVSDSNKQGKNFKLSTGANMEIDRTQNDWYFNTTERDRILFNIQPTSIHTDNNTSITYDISIYNNKLEKEIISQPFSVKGNNLQLELLASDLSQSLVYGPDFIDPITGAYHIRNNFPDGEYTLKAEITAIGSNLTQPKIIDEFKGTISS